MPTAKLGNKTEKKEHPTHRQKKKNSFCRVTNSKRNN